MKRYGNLFDLITDIDNIKLAHKNARKNKTHYREVQEVDNNLDFYCSQIREMLINNTFVNSPYESFKKLDKGKKRTIFKLPYFPDRIIHHAIVQVVEDIWKKTLIKDTYQSIKGRGLHKAVRKIQKIAYTSDDKLYYLKMDISKFYPSINNTKLKQTIRQKIKCKRTLNLLDIIIDSIKGVPIGNYLSQYFGNLYLSKLDHKIKEYYKVEYYFRYCDDIVIIHKDKEFLHFILMQIKIELHTLDLELKRNYCVRPISEGLDFLGVVVYAGYSKIRKRIKYNYIIVSKKSNNERRMASYIGWLMLVNSFNLRNKYEKGFKMIIEASEELQLDEVKGSKRLVRIYIDEQVSEEGIKKIRYKELEFDSCVLNEIVEDITNKTKKHLYIELRQAEYPPMEDYLDAIVKGDTQAEEEYKQKCLTVKSKYPKDA